MLRLYTLLHARSVALILAVSLFHTTAQAQPNNSMQERTHPTVIAPEQDETLHTEEDTLYRGLWHLFLGDEAPILNVVPHMRATHMFSATEGSCRYPATRLIGQYNKGPISFEGVPLVWSESFFEMTVRIFTRSDTPAPIALEELYGRSVVAPLGYIFPPGFDEEKVSLLSVASERQRISLLMNGRVDYLVSSMPTAGIAMRHMGYDSANFDASLLLKELPLFLVCHDTPQNRALVAKFNEGIKAAKANGTIETTYRYYKQLVTKEPTPDRD